jgi:hypothetical protein
MREIPLGGKVAAERVADKDYKFFIPKRDPVAFGLRLEHSP